MAISVNFLVGKMRKGVYFTIDSIIAAGTILAVIIFSYSFFSEERPIFHLSYMSQDLINILSELTVEEIDNEYLNILIGDGTIKNKDNTILGQVSVFWAGSNIALANRTVSNVTEPLVPDGMGFGVWVNNRTIYTRDMPLQKSLVSSRTIISGIMDEQPSSYTRNNPPELSNPVVVEVRVWQ